MIDPAMDRNDDPIYWPNMQAYEKTSLIGQINGTVTWHS
jgi:hypothetical protein